MTRPRIRKIPIRRAWNTSLRIRREFRLRLRARARFRISPTCPPDIEADPTRVVHVFAPAGGRIVEMKVRPWDRVEKGQTLATLESSDLARAVADYHKALADQQVKQKALASRLGSLEHNAISEKDFQQAQADAQQTQAEVDAAREQIQVFGMDPDQRLDAALGEGPARWSDPRYRSGAPENFRKRSRAPAPLRTVADITSVWAVGDIYEKDLTAAKSGEAAQVTLNAYPDQHWAGRVSVVSDAVDPATRTLHVRVVLPNSDGRIKPGIVRRDPHFCALLRRGFLLHRAQ